MKNSVILPKSKDVISINLIETNWEIESNFAFAGLRSKKTQAIDSLFKSAKRDTEWLQKLYNQSVTWQEEESNSFWQLSARTKAVQKLAYRTAQELVNRYSTTQQIALSAVINNFINIIYNNTPDHQLNTKHSGKQWDKQSMFGCPTGIKKLRELAKYREKLGDFRFLWMARNIIEERLKPNWRENPFSIFSQIKRSSTTQAFYSGFLEKCNYSNENFLEDLNGFLNTFKGDKPFLDRNSLMRPPSILIL